MTNVIEFIYRLNRSRMENLDRLVTGKLALGRKAYFQSIINLQGTQCGQVPPGVISSSSVSASENEPKEGQLSADELRHIRYHKFRLVELE